MALLPTPSSGSLLRWTAGGTLENVTISELLDQIASQTEPDPATQKYWIDTSALTGVSITLTGASMALTGGTPVVDVAGDIDIALTGASMALAGGTPTIAVAGADIDITLTGVSMEVAGGTPTVGVAGSSVAVSDTFDRADDSTLGANWAQITGSSYRFRIFNNAALTQSGQSAAFHGDRWSADSFSGDHYSEVDGSPGCAVRVQSDAATFYCIYTQLIDEGDAYMTLQYQLAKCVGGTFSTLDSPWMVDDGGAGGGYGAGVVYRLEANGTSLVFSTSPSHGGTYTTQKTITDAAISGGGPGIVGYAAISVTYGSSNNNAWYGGDL